MLKSSGFKVIATALSKQSVPVDQVDWSRPTAVIFGNEKEGAPPPYACAAHWSLYVGAYHISAAQPGFCSNCPTVAVGDFGLVQPIVDAPVSKGGKLPPSAFHRVMYPVFVTLFRAPVTNLDAHGRATTRFMLVVWPQWTRPDNIWLARASRSFRHPSSFGPSRCLLGIALSRVIYHVACRCGLNIRLRTARFREDSVNVQISGIEKRERL